MRDAPREVPAVLGQVVSGKGSGRSSVARAVETLGISEGMREVLSAIKQRALETKSLLRFEEIARIVAELLGARAAEPVV